MEDKTLHPEIQHLDIFALRIAQMFLGAIGTLLGLFCFIAAILMREIEWLSHKSWLPALVGMLTGPACLAALGKAGYYTHRHGYSLREAGDSLEEQKKRWAHNNYTVVLQDIVGLLPLAFLHVANGVQLTSYIYRVREFGIVVSPHLLWIALGGIAAYIFYISTKNAKQWFIKNDDPKKTNLS